MKTRFVLMTGVMTPEQQTSLTAELQPPVCWWHYLPNSWLIVDPNGSMDLVSLTDIIGRAAPQVWSMAIQAEHGWWYSRLPEDQANAKGWMATYWEPD